MEKKLTHAMICKRKVDLLAITFEYGDVMQAFCSCSFVDSVHLIVFLIYYSNIVYTTRAEAFLYSIVLLPWAAYDLLF